MPTHVMAGTFYVADGRYIIVVAFDVLALMTIYLGQPE